MNATRRKLPEEEGVPAAQLIDARIEELDDWRGPMLARIRDLIRRPTPMWSRNGSGGYRCGRTGASSARAKPTSRP